MAFSAIALRSSGQRPASASAARAVPVSRKRPLLGVDVLPDARPLKFRSRSTSRVQPCSSNGTRLVAHHSVQPSRRLRLSQTTGSGRELLQCSLVRVPGHPRPTRCSRWRCAVVRPGAGSPIPRSAPCTWRSGRSVWFDRRSPELSPKASRDLEDWAEKLPSVFRDRTNGTGRSPTAPLKSQKKQLGFVCQGRRQRLLQLNRTRAASTPSASISPGACHGAVRGRRRPAMRRAHRAAHGACGR